MKIAIVPSFLPDNSWAETFEKSREFSVVSRLFSKIYFSGLIQSDLVSRNSDTFFSFEQRIEERKSLRNRWLEEDSNFGKPLTRSQSYRRPWEPNYRDKQAKSAAATTTMT